MTNHATLDIIGIDVGGTFTDLLAIDHQGKIFLIKKPSTPKMPHLAVVAALNSLLAEFSNPPEIKTIAHSTTIATNALLGQVGLELPQTAIITTEGFRDLIEIGRQNRSEVYNLSVSRPEPIVSRQNRFTIRERMDFQGRVITPLDKKQFAAICDQLQKQNIQAVAICLLNSYVNKDHEMQIAAEIAEKFPELSITCSAEINPEYREYERFSTAVVNAALSPLVKKYLHQITDALKQLNIECVFYVMQSNGGMVLANSNELYPANLIESGPASGVIAAAYLGKLQNQTHLLTFDMGGTTAKAGAIIDFLPQIATEFEAAGKTHSGRAVKGSGYPVRFPFIDLAEISAGGGTIAWVDEANSLRVGPLSAGADPGPACYGHSNHPTVTDANIVLGRLNAKHLLGGTFPIDASKSQASIAQLADKLGLTVEATAAGIITIINAQMAKALRMVTVERGLDPRDFTLVAFGGNGPLHACSLAEELSINHIIIPEHPGIFSAYGLICAKLQVNYLEPILQEINNLDFVSLEKIFLNLEEQGRKALIAQNVLAKDIQFRREYDARYRGQSFELTIAHAATLEQIAERFHEQHRLRYGYDVKHEAIELVNARLTAYASPRQVPLFTQQTPKENVKRALQHQKQQRAVWIENQFISTPIFSREELVSMQSIAGPAIIEQYDTTIFINQGWKGEAKSEHLHLSVKDHASADKSNKKSSTW